MNEEINFCLDLAREQMQESLNHLEISLSKIRAGKASPQMLRAVVVDYYGSVTPLTQMANVTTPDSQTITIQPFDKSMIADIEQAIVNAQLGFNPSNNGEKVIIKSFEKPKGFIARKLSSSIQDPVDRLANIIEEKSMWQKFGL